MKRLAALCALALASCTGVRYLAQAVEGQVEILHLGRPISEVVADPSTPPHLRRLLAQVGPIKAFGEASGLRATKNYREFADLGRPAAVWVVGACEPLAFVSKKWKFPIVGSVPYLGWFDKKEAQSYGDELREDGWEVEVRPAAAYSTLGWFEDPVLSTMLEDGPEGLGELANVVLHESTHATHYVDGQTAFDESIANFVGDRLASKFLAETRGEDSSERRMYLAAERAHRHRSGAMHDAYRELEKLYASDVSDTTKRIEKGIILARLRVAVGTRRPVNNATLFEYESYHGGEVELDRLLAACGGDFRRFVGALQRISSSSFSEPQQRDLARVLRPLVTAGCPG